MPCGSPVGPSLARVQPKTRLLAGERSRPPMDVSGPSPDDVGLASTRSQVRAVSFALSTVEKFCPSRVVSPTPMATSSLRSALNDLASTFTTGVLAAIRAASIEDLLEESSGSRRSARAAAPTRAVGKGGRLARRSADQIAKAIEQVVSLVKKNKGGLRSEQIRKQLDLDVREVPRILKTAVATKKLKSRGQKRATVYFVR